MIVTNEDIAGSLLPNINISRIILQSREDDTLLANVQLLFRQSYSNDDISSWLEDSTALQYLKVFIIQSTNDEATKFIKLAFDGIEARGFFNNEQSFEQLKQLMIRRNIISPNTDEVQYREISLFELAGAGTENKIQELVRTGKAEKTVDSNGNNIYDIYQDINFTDNTQENVQHLSFLVGTMYDLSSLVAAIEGQNEFAINVGELFVESVINDGIVEQSMSIYVDEAEEVWPGPIHIIERRGQVVFRSGQTETENSVDLFVREIENYKIQDLRELRRITNFLNTIVVPDSEELDNIELAVTRQMTDKYDNSFISEAYTSIDGAGNATINFFVDLKKMFIKNSVLGQVLAKSTNPKSKDLINQYYRYMSIESVVLYAKRIDIDESLTPNKTTEKKVAEFLGIQQIETVVKRIYLPANSRRDMQQLVMFSLFHNEELNQGVYQYRLELEVKEDLVTQIKTIIRNLKIEQSPIIEYYNYSVLPDNFNEVTNRFRPGAFSGIRQSIPNNNDYFRTLLETLRNIFNLTTAVVSEQNNSSGLIQPSNTPRDSISDILLKWVDPVQGTPTTISYVLNTYETVIKALQDSIQSTAVVNNSINEKGDAFATQVKTESTSKIIKLQKSFNSTVDFENEYLLEYLDHTRKDTSGFNSEGSFLYDVIKTDLISKKYDINSKNTTSRNLNEQNEAVFNKLNKIFSDSSELVIDLFVEPPSQKNIEFSTVRDLQTSIGPRNINTFLEATSDKSRDLSINDKRVLNTLLSTLMAPTVDKSMKELEVVFDTSSDDNIYQKITPNSATRSGFKIFNLFKNKKTAKNDLTQIPNHIKSLIKIKTEQTSVALSDAEIRLKYELINSVKCLTGFTYNTESRTFDVSAPIWTNLTKSLINGLQDSVEQFMFCSMQAYNSDSIGYKHNQALTNTAINSVFLISKSAVNTTPRSIASINIDQFERRCVFELQKYFNNNEEPEVGYTVGGISISDSYENTKYSFLAPHGIQINGVFRSLSLTESTIIDFDIVVPQPPIIDLDSVSIRSPFPSPPQIPPPLFLAGQPVPTNQDTNVPPQAPPPLFLVGQPVSTSQNTNVTAGNLPVVLVDSQPRSSPNTSAGTNQNINTATPGSLASFSRNSRYR